MKVRIKNKDGITKVKLLTKHNMETGYRRNKKDGKIIPAHFITDLEAVYKGEVIFNASLGPGVAKDPYLSFSFKGGSKGETIDFSWVDNKGQSDKTQETI